MKRRVVQPNLANIYKKLIDQGEELATVRREMVSKQQFDRTVHTLDKILLTVTRIDQERVFTTEWIRRIERDVERLKRRLQVV